MKKTTIDDITPVEGHVIGTIGYLGTKIDSKIFLDPDTKKKLQEEDQPLLKIRRVSKDSEYKVGQQVFVTDGRINATVIKINDIEYYILPEFEIRAIVNA